MLSSEQREKDFISHSSKDQNMWMRLSIIEKVWVSNTGYFYSSTIETGVQPGELIFDTIKGS